MVLRKNTYVLQLLQVQLKELIINRTRKIKRSEAEIEKINSRRILYSIQ